MSEPQAPVVASTDLFGKCVIIKPLEDGAVSIRCKLGLWYICGPVESSMREARNYWIQYFQDGEYADLLSNPGVLRAGHLVAGTQEPVVQIPKSGETK